MSNETTDSLREKFTLAMSSFSNYGTRDSEGDYAIARIEDAILYNKKFPLTGENPFELYQSVTGWNLVSERLIELAHAYWRAAVIENLSLDI